MPPAAAIRLAVMHSLEALSAVVILDCMCMVCMVETSSDGRERVYVMFVCQVRVVGTVGGSQNGLYRELVFVGQVYLTLDRKGLAPFPC